MKRFAFALLCLLTVSPSFADDAASSPQFRLFGDVRLRAEADWDSTTSNGGQRDDRDRIRFRTRLGLEWNVASWSITTRLRSGNTNSQQSPHVTIIQSGDKGDGDVLVDRAVMKFSKGGRNFWFGRNGHPFWKKTEFLFDDDVYWDGVGFSTPIGPSGRLHGIAAFVPEGQASLDLQDQGTLLGLQFVHPVAGTRGTVGATMVRISDDHAVANPVLLDLDYTIVDVTIEWKPSTPNVSLGAEVISNIESPDSGVFNRGERTGVVVWASKGSLSHSGNWLGAIYLAHIEKYAVVSFLSQDDWLRWGSATQTRSSNFEGVELRLARALRDDLNVVARLYIVEALELESAGSVSKEDGNRARLDLNWKF